MVPQKAVIIKVETEKKRKSAKYSRILSPSVAAVRFVENQSE